MNGADDQFEKYNLNVIEHLNVSLHYPRDIDITMKPKKGSSNIVDAFYEENEHLKRSF